MFISYIGLKKKIKPKIFRWFTMGVEFRRRNVPVPDQYSSLSQPKETQYPLTGRDRHCYTQAAQTWNCSRFIWGGIAKSVNQCALLQTDHRVRLRYQVPRLVKKLLQAQIIPRINSRRPVYANKAINQNCLCNKWAGTALQNFKGRSRHSMPIQCATRARLCKKPAKSLTLGFSQNSMAYYLAKRILVMPESATSVNQTQIPVKFFWDNDNPILSLIICTSGCSSPNF